jgi:hypothetical protein
LLSKEEIAQLTESLRKFGNKGKVFVCPAIFNSGALEYAEQLGTLFKGAGFEVRSVDIEKLEKDYVTSFPFSGVRIRIADKANPPPHAAYIQKCFVAIGREMPGDIDKDVDPDTVLIAIGGRP